MPVLSSVTRPLTTCPPQEEPAVWPRPTCGPALRPQNDQTSRPLPYIKPAPNDNFSQKQPNAVYRSPKTTKTAHLRSS